MKFSDRWRMVQIGLIVLILGSSPLATVILLARLGVTSDPNPNPVGFGILAMLTFWPSIIVIAAGVVQALRNPSTRNG